MTANDLRAAQIVTGGGPAPRVVDCEQRLLTAVAFGFGVDRRHLCAPTRGRADIALARQAGMYLARVALGQTLSRAGRLFGRDRTTAAHACRVVEDLRDDPHFDALLHAMESFVTPRNDCDEALQ
ncbi:helix-turn-helix domain-containing protein [Pseudorhodoplanes sp.]|uniref:helix-turn-helix domain-containing protein n=1 Tax=Pseudorhodoplanes sp. TaxID=1934341 RepID=UPI00391D8552